MLWNIFAGDREYKRVFGQFLCGEVEAPSFDEALEQASKGNWKAFFQLPPTTVGYWPVRKEN